jgi:hypothetical protein
MLMQASLALVKQKAVIYPDSRDSIDEKEQ